eukprot:130956_1
MATLRRLYFSVLSESGESKQPERTECDPQEKNCSDSSFLNLFNDDGADSDSMDQLKYFKYCDAMNMNLTVNIPQNKNDLIPPIQPAYKLHLKLMNDVESITNPKVIHSQNHYHYKKKKKKKD